MRGIKLVRVVLAALELFPTSNNHVKNSSPLFWGVVLVLGVHYDFLGYVVRFWSTLWYLKVHCYILKYIVTFGIILLLEQTWLDLGLGFEECQLKHIIQLYLNQVLLLPLPIAPPYAIPTHPTKSTPTLSLSPTHPTETNSYPIPIPYTAY